MGYHFIKKNTYLYIIFKFEHLQKNPLLQHEHTNLKNDTHNPQGSTDSLPTKDTMFYMGELKPEDLLNLLFKREENLFIQSFQKYHSFWTEHEMSTNAKQTIYFALLLAATGVGLNKAVKLLLQTGVDLNPKIGKLSAVESACSSGNSKALQMLLEQFNVNLDYGLLITTALSFLLNEQSKTNEIGDYNGCLDVLFDAFHIDENEANYWRQFFFHCALFSRDEKTIMPILERGVYLNMKSMLVMNSKVLEDFFDKCITSNGKRCGSEDFEIIINYKNLLPNKCSQRDVLDKTLKEYFGKVTNVAFDELNNTDRNSIYKYILPYNSDQNEEMLPIKYMAESDDLKNLLNHPLITGFLFLKWHNLSLFFYMNFILTSLFCIILILYIILHFNDGFNEAVKITFMILSFLGLLYTIIREIIQCITLKMEMFTASFAALANCVEFLLIIFTILTLSQSDYNQEPQRTYAVITIFLASFELYLHVGSLPILAISIHMLMLREVCASFIKSFFQYSILFVTFGLCFHMVFGKALNPNYSNDGYFNSTWGSVFKVLIMSTGEFDSGNLKFNSPSSYGIFLLFVGFMEIVLFNLLNGLAVNDTQMIRAQAELNRTICRIYLLANLDKFLSAYTKFPAFPACQTFLNKKAFNSLRQKFTSFGQYNHGNQIIIRPNDGNKVFISKGDNDERELFRSPMSILPFCCSFKLKFSAMENKIVQAALEVIKKKEKYETKQKTILEQEIRLKNIEKTGEIILSLLQSFVQSTSRDVKE